jgi:hypothetical protein
MGTEITMKVTEKMTNEVLTALKTSVKTVNDRQDGSGLWVSGDGVNISINDDGSNYIDGHRVEDVNVSDNDERVNLSFTKNGKRWYIGISKA